MARGWGVVLVGIKHTVRGVWGAGVVSGREWFVCVCVGVGVCVWGGVEGLLLLLRYTARPLTSHYHNDTRHLISVMGGLSLACW